ncbi:DNA excision repair protein ERCC-6-like [Saccostrea echinata]|uniref:DNA excision repair protein ERCC-6-like n=1 Tax=Saccostrea echinata TaxID=191078 RepID=UPI002A7EF2AB|nr:DNA excision repair protein ERCC-6-like [Saccostrea echinata]
MSEIQPSSISGVMEDWNGTVRGECPPESGHEDSAPQEEDSTTRFHVDRTLIPSAQLAEMNEDSELGDLGLTVFNQEEFEEGVMAQVDMALAKEEEEQQKKKLQKEETDIKYDIAKVKKEVETMDKVLSTLGNAVGNSHVRNRLVSVQNQRENKLSQLKTLYARQRALQIKINGTSDIPQDVFKQDGAALNKLLGLGSKSETEKEKMIRLGQMTPFGTVVSSSTEKDPKFTGEGVNENGSSKETISNKETHESSNSSVSHGMIDSPASTSQNTDRSENFFDSRDKKSYRNDVEGAFYKHNYRSKRRYSRISRNFREDSALSDEENCYYDDPEGYLSEGDEYQPEEGELVRPSSEDSGLEDEPDISKEKKRKKKSSIIKPKKPPKYFVSNEDEDFAVASKRKINRDIAERKGKDDGDEDFYHSRIEEFNKLERKRLKRVDTGEIEEELDEELEGGLRVPGRIWSKLFNYQRVGVSWLWELHCQSAGGIIGDEMGLGKTIQMIAFLAALRQSKIVSKHFKYRGLGPTVIVTPTTVMSQWVKEFHKWWPLFRVAILHSSGSFTGNEEELVRSIVKDKGVLITSFSTLVIHQDKILPYDWHYVVLDEGHKIRNPDAQVTQACKQFRTPHRIILSGSPIQNNLKELWSLFDFVFPGKLGTLPDFLQHFSIPIVQGGYANATEMQVQTAYKCACVLRDTINPYLLRRMKADVKINLPSKNEQVLFCRLTDEQRDVYLEYLQSRECQAILAGKYQIFAGLITLRKICNHPDICTGGPKLFIGEDSQGDPSLEYGYWKRSGKMIVVEALLKLWKQQGHRVLLFSQSRAMLDILESFTQSRNYSYLRMDGGTPISSRQAMITTYNQDPSIYLFLLTTRVGGLGVNLTGANRVIIFDPDWNPSTDTQARERTWRIGQTKQVTIYRLLTSGTIEEKIYHRQIFKQFLTNRVLKDPKQRRFFKSNDLYELFELGSKGNKEGTETGAIFAGTGSEVKRSEVKERANRFDVLQDKKKAEAVKEEEEDQYFDESEIKRMRELAKMLSSKLMKSKSSEKVPHNGSAITNNTAGICSVESKNLFQMKSDSSAHGSEDSKDSVQSSIMESENSQLPSTSSQGCSQISVRLDSNDRDCHDKQSDKAKSSPHHQNKSPSSKDKSHHRHSHHKKHHKHHKHKHRKRVRDAEFEGKKIPHLVKQDVYKQNQEKEEEEKKIMDDYVLHKLFKKGIDTAMKHDVIMDPSKHDYMIVENEAARVAKEAARALKRSRSACNLAITGLPTWTGQSGVKKPRFGQKKNSMLIDSTKKQETQPAASVSTLKKSDSDPPVKHFDGSLVGNVVKDLKTGQSSSSSMTSDLLLNQMKKRNELVATPGDEEEDDMGDNSTNPVIDLDSYKLISEIKNFILFGCSMIGKASTQEILDEFGPKLPPSNSSLFKAMLNKICVFERNNGIGFWKLRNEFR